MSSTLSHLIFCFIYRVCFVYLSSSIFLFFFFFVTVLFCRYVHRAKLLHVDICFCVYVHSFECLIHRGPSSSGSTRWLGSDVVVVVVAFRPVGTASLPQLGVH